MKRTPRTLFAAIMIVATTAAFLIGCKKDDSTTTAADTPTANELARGEATLAKIMNFKQQVEYYRAYPNVKDGATMSIDEAVWNIEALFNLTYSYPELSYGRTVTADTVLFLPLQADNSVLLTDLSVFYGQMYEAVSAIYHSVNLDSKQFLILDVEEGIPSGDRLPVTLHSVQGTVKGIPPTPPSPPSPWMGPFEEGWYYGENLGDEEGDFIDVMDATDTLSRLLNAVLVPVAPEGCSYFYTNVKMKELGSDSYVPYTHNLYPNLGPYCEFYKENPTTLCDFLLNTDMMNFHYFGECYLVQNHLRYYVNEPIPTYYYLFQISIMDLSYTNNNNLYVIKHHTKAWYGNREVVQDNVIIRASLD